MFAVSLFTALGLGLWADSAEWRFDHGTAFPDLERDQDGDDITAGDVDGDGRIDIVCNADDIRWYKNLGGRRPEWRRSEPIAPEHKDWTGERGWMGVWTGDFDGDGDLDVCGGAKGSFGGISHPTAWFENTKGDGTRWIEHRLPVTGDLPDHSRSRDFNGDGRDDLIVQKYHGSGVYYLPSPVDPKGPWKAYKIGTGRSGVSLHDMDRDGDVDVLVDDRWLENPGDPARENWPVHQITGAAGGVKNDAGDLNGDGYVDVVHSSEEGVGIWCFLGPADPRKGSWEKHTLSNERAGNHTMHLADFDGDGDLDILTAEMHTRPRRRVTVFENADGKGGRWIEHVIATTGSHNARAVDVNGDGRPDIIGKNFSGRNPIDVWYNTLDAQRRTGRAAGPIQ